MTRRRAGRWHPDPLPGHDGEPGRVRPVGHRRRPAPPTCARRAHDHLRVASDARGRDRRLPRRRADAGRPILAEQPGVFNALRTCLEPEWQRFNQLPQLVRDRT
ncbi:hypothetical protein Francci3_0996 [Frankia casuarinae]|uniref:Uncharacterized protein n=1 Tax=Frankia casuarinae (strain DSM 45818 / CECT 9043 / HFP020203 / CcI3) TaxID=106370 RepID=Q2JEB3_FRACC|nr:hypothetical protein Francci3_0996 [Frankia casuarinae]